MRLWLKLALAAAVVILLALILVPLFVNGAALRPRVQAQLTTALGRNVTLGSLSFSLLHGSLVAQDIAIADDPAFSTAPFLRAHQLNVGVQVLPLLLHHQVDITRLVVDQPTITLMQGQSGKWNFSSIGGKHANSTEPLAHPSLTVAELEIDDGTAYLATLPPNSRPAATPKPIGAGSRTGNAGAAVLSIQPQAPLVFTGLNLKIKNFSFTAAFPFDLSATLPAKASLKLAGTAGPIAAAAEETPFQAALHLTRFDPVAAGFIQPGAGISAILDVDSDLRFDGTTLAGIGKIKADRLQLARSGSPSPEPIAINYNISVNLADRTGQLADLSVKAGPDYIRAAGAFALTPAAIVLDLHLAARSVPIDPMEKLLPVVGIQLPAGSRLRGGTLTASLTVTGPATAAVLAGPVQIDNTSLAGFDLGSRIEGLNPFGARSGGTEIRSLRATIRSSPQLTRVESIQADLPQLGTATGSGTVSPSGALDFKMVATLAPSNVATALGSLATHAVGQVRGFVRGVLHRKPSQMFSLSANQGIPLTITGTASNPVIRADVAGLLR